MRWIKFLSTLKFFQLYKGNKKVSYADRASAFVVDRVNIFLTYSLITV